MIISEKRLNKPQQIIYEAIKKAGKGLKIVLPQNGNGRALCKHQLELWKKIFKGNNDHQ